VLNPSFAACSIEYKRKFPNPSAVKVSGRSSLVLKGDGLIIESLVLDGALVVECEEGATGVIRNLSVQNKGWVKVSDEDSSNEIIKMRGYYINKLETRKIVFKQDGSIEGDYSPETPEENPVEESCATESTEEEKPEILPSAPVEVKVDEPQSKSVDQDSAPAPLPTPNEQTKTVETNPPVAESEHVSDLSKPALSEAKEKDALCGGACIIM
jgi:cytoskeletal protein CcmA (bactofilin family)